MRDVASLCNRELRIFNAVRVYPYICHRELRLRLIVAYSSLFCNVSGGSHAAAISVSIIVFNIVIYYCGCYFIFANPGFDSLYSLDGCFTRDRNKLEVHRGASLAISICDDAMR